MKRRRTFVFKVADSAARNIELKNVLNIAADEKKCRLRK